MEGDKFKVKDDVYCILHGKGVICGIDEGKVFPVRVVFGDDTEETYTEDGRLHPKSNRVLFFEKITIPKSAYSKRAKPQESYYYVTDTGEIQYYRDGYRREDDKRFRCGNYFKTAEQAKESCFYKAFL